MVCVNGDGIGRLGVSEGDRVEAAFGEGVTAGEAPEGHPGTADGAETDQSDVGVFGAGGQIEALRGAEGVQDGRNDGLIDAEGEADGETGLGWGVFGHCGQLLDEFGGCCNDFRRFEGEMLQANEEGTSLLGWTKLRENKRVSHCQM
jgi:hypothetical protein